MELSAKAVFDAVKEQDEVACEIAEQFGEYLGKALAAVAGVVNPEIFVIGGGVLHVTPDTCRIIADLVENEDNLTDEEYIIAQKKEAEELKNAFILEGKSVEDPTKLIELEYELLKFTAMHQLMMKKKNNQTV